MRQTLRLPDVQHSTITFAGGFDVVTPPLQTPPGRVRLAQNLECDINSGYARVLGYERYSGKPRPSDASYSIITATITGAPAVGNTLTGQTSAATGVVIALPGGSFVLTKVTGIFQSGENLQVTAVTVAVATSGAVASGASTPKLHAQYKNLAADVYRADIAAVPGSGNVLGVWLYNDIVYAFRNNAGGTAADMYKSSASGWTQVVFGEEISFSNANTSVNDADTLTQGAVTATIARVVVQTGTLASGVNTGRLIITGRAGGNFAAGAATSSGGGALTLSGAQTAITLQPNGRFEFVNQNFGGSATTAKMYGCDGQNRAFEFDGTTFVPIATGMTVDKPVFIIAHLNFLFLAFGASVQFSGVGNPYTWTVITGAGEIAMGANVSGFSIGPGSSTTSALVIFTRTKIGVLYGTGASTFQMVDFELTFGSVPYTIQHVFSPMFLADQGVTTLEASQVYGNFEKSTLTHLIKTWLDAARNKACASCVVRNKNQYRVFFTDGYALTITMDGAKVLGAMPQLYVNAVRCIVSGLMSDGTETIYFGSTNGFVYQVEKGTSFDGENIEWFGQLTPDFLKSPRVDKRYRSCTFEVQGSGYAEFGFSYQLGYGAAEIAQPFDATYVTSFSSVFWDAFVFDAFVWDGTTLGPNRADVAGTAENIALIVRGNSDYMESIKFSGATLRYTPRKPLR